MFISLKIDARDILLTIFTLFHNSSFPIVFPRHCNYFHFAIYGFSIAYIWTFHFTKSGVAKIWNNCSKSMNNKTYLHFWNCYWVLNIFIAFDWAYTGKSLFQNISYIYLLPLTLTGIFSVKRLKLGSKIYYVAY